MESPEGQGSHPDTFWRAEESVSHDFFLQQSDGTQPFPVLIPSTSTPFPPAADWERLDPASRCQTHSVSCSRAESRGMQHTNPLTEGATKDRHSSNNITLPLLLL